MLLLLFVARGWLIAAFVILFSRSAISKFFTPAETGLLQGSLNKEQYVQAAGLNQTVTGLFMLFGMGLGATAYHYLGIELTIVIDGLSFLVSGILVSACRFPVEMRRPNGTSDLKQIHMRSVVADFLEGWVYIRRHKLLLAITFILAGFLFYSFTLPKLNREHLSAWPIPPASAVSE